MSTCRGTYRDDHVPSDVGVLACVQFACCSHAPTERCAEYGDQPHFFDQCGEFEPPRPGFEPPPEPKARAGRAPWIYDWDMVYVRLARGESVYTILQERCLTHDC
jgi:hypothetical protein